MIEHQAAGLLRPGAVPKRLEATSSRVLGIVSGKGGVGKSTLAVNLATAAAAAGARTLLVDGDLGLANADLLMGVVPHHDLEDWSAGRVALSETLCSGPAGLDLLVAGSGGRAARLLEEAVAGGMAAGLGRLVAQADLCILDLGAGIGEGVLELARHCRPVWLVASPEPTSLADAYTIAKRLWERAPALEIELVVNRAPDRLTGERTHQALDRLMARFLGRSLRMRAVLPDDPAMSRAVARQSPVVLEYADAPVARRLVLLAESLLEEWAVVPPAPPLRQI